MLCQPKSPELPTAEATWLRARRAAGLPERAGLPLRSRWRNGSRFSAHEWNAWSPPEPIVWLKKMHLPRVGIRHFAVPSERDDLGREWPQLERGQCVGLQRTARQSHVRDVVGER